MERVQSGERELRVLQQKLEAQQGGFILALVEQARGGIAMPAVGVFESGYQLGGRSFAEAGRFWERVAIRDDAVNAATIVAAVEVEKFFNVVGQRPWVLDDFAIHVDDVKGAIRSIGELNRT